MFLKGNFYLKCVTSSGQAGVFWTDLWPAQNCGLEDWNKMWSELKWQNFGLDRSVVGDGVSLVV